MPEILETIGPRAGSAPVSVTLSELGAVEIESAFAHYDGSAASGSWLAAFTVRSQDGSILSRVFPSTTLASGDTADVSFVPLGEAESSSAGGSGIQFDTSPQAGDWLLIATTDGTASPSGQYGVDIHDSTAGSATSMILRTDTGELDVSAGDQLGLSSGSNMLLQCFAALVIDWVNSSQMNGQNDMAVNIDGDWAFKFQNNAEGVKVFGTGPTLVFSVKGNGKVYAGGLPTAAGSSGELYVDALGFVKRA